MMRFLPHTPEDRRQTLRTDCRRDRYRTSTPFPAHVVELWRDHTFGHRLPRSPRRFGRRITRVR